MFHRRRPVTTTHTRPVTTTHTKPSLMTRLRGRSTRPRTAKTTTKTAPPRNHFGRRGHRGHAYASTPVHHHKRKTTLGDKVSGAMLKLKGSLTHRPGVKAAGTRRMHGTDGRGSHAPRVY